MGCTPPPFWRQPSCLAVLINLLVRAIPKKYTEFDLSAAKMYTLGDSSRQLMQSLDQDVTVYYLCETGSEDAIITKLLDHYADESGHFHWEQKDPALYPTFAAQYGAENASTGSLIVVSGENSEVLNAAELYEYDYSDYYTTGVANVTFGGEKQISSAIYKLTAAAESHAYYTTNHGEQALTDTLTDALENQNLMPSRWICFPPAPSRRTATCSSSTSLHRTLPRRALWWMR